MNFTNNNGISRVSKKKEFPEYQVFLRMSKKKIQEFRYKDLKKKIAH
jgi:hypothetical protein